MSQFREDSRYQNSSSKYISQFDGDECDDEHMDLTPLMEGKRLFS